MDLLQSALLVFLAYLLGSIPFAYMVTRWKTGLDIRTVGSRNAGAGNVYRNAGFAAGTLVLVTDVSKGALAMQAAGWLGASSLVTYCTGIAAVSGHNWSIFFRFSGGKGIATLAGVSLFVVPSLTLIAGFPAALTLALTRSAITATFVGVAVLHIGIFITGQPFYILVLSLSMALVALIAGITRVHVEAETPALLAKPPLDPAEKARP